MAGDWIKMRSNLWDDPRVASICDATNSGEAAIIGGLYWLWASADQHTEDGLMPGLTIRAVDRKTGIDGFGAALVAIGWAQERAEGVQIVRFEEHNGKSAKRRCSESVRKMSARNADKERTTTGQIAEVLQQSCATREREREREETNTTPAKQARFDFLAALVDAGVEQSIAEDFLTLRKQKKGAQTKTAFDMLAKEAEKSGMQLQDVVRVCIKRNWVSFDASWIATQSKAFNPAVLSI